VNAVNRRQRHARMRGDEIADFGQTDQALALAYE